MKMFEPLYLAHNIIPSRIVMAPMTRNRAEQDGSPSKLMRTYYEQRAFPGLMIAEATAVSPMAIGYPFAPGVYTEKHITNWKSITEAVHQRGGKIFLQIWHAGRVSHPDYHQGNLPVAPSTIPLHGVAKTYQGEKPFITPRALLTTEIPNIIAEFQMAAENAKRAGFDGVEVHAGNGYLIEQFLKDSTGQRTDCYGGSIANRTRLCLEIINAIATVWHRDQISLRISPERNVLGVFDSNPIATYTYLVEQLNTLPITFLHYINDFENTSPDQGNNTLLKKIRFIFKGKIIVNGGFNEQNANFPLVENLADMVSFGRLFISNPDLPYRLKQQFPLQTANKKNFYKGGKQGYTDYPNHVNYIKNTIGSKL